MLAAAAWTVSASSQSASDTSPVDADAGLLADIAEAAANGNRYSKELIAPLTALSLRYHEAGEPALAIAAIEEALQIVRANFGLRSLEQVPLIRLRIASEESRENFAEAWKLEQELLALARAHPNDLQAAEIFGEIGDKRMAALERYVAGEYTPQIVLGCYYATMSKAEGTEDAAGAPSCTSGSRRRAAGALLLDAQRNYVAAVNVFRRNQLFASTELRELELDLARSSYSYREYELVRSKLTYTAYETGRQSLSRLVDYDAASSQPLMKRIDSLMQVADWDLLFPEPARGLQTYEQIYRLMKSQGISQVEIDAVFSPATPIWLPTFLPNPLDSDSEQATGHIDVAFDIGRFGTTRRIEVLDTSSASPAARQRVVDVISRGRFRPIMIEGEIPRSSRVVARYFVKE
jgi:hypothetical protein